MLWKMSGVENKTLPIEGDKPMKKSYKKHVIIGVSCVTVVLLILIAIIVGMYLFTDAFHKIIKESMQTVKGANQEMTADLSANIVEYRVNMNGYETIHLDDYNYYISVVKLTIEGDFYCYATALNVSSKPDFAKVQRPETINETNIEEYVFVRNRQPIPDTSFLSKKAQSMCKGISTYWVTETCSSNNGYKQLGKRGMCGKACDVVCKWINKNWKCSKYCWIADIGCTIFGWFGR